MSEREPVVAIDGPAGVGKSTAARALARRFGYRFLDTGSMYRAVAWSVAGGGISPADGPALRQHLARLAVALDGERVRVNGRDVTDEIRTPEISELTSRLTMLAVVRDKLTPLQQALAAPGGAVLEGRDTGTVVCPDAEVKFYLDASLETRARRRQAELAAGGVTVGLETVREQLRARDRQDTERELAPLRCAPDAIRLDTSALTAEQVVEIMTRAVERRRMCCTSS
ncbi:MAG: (d)CMP kinase [Candidatus Rokuibacteriota bacterium]